MRYLLLFFTVILLIGCNVSENKLNIVDKVNLDLSSPEKVVNYYMRLNDDAESKRVLVSIMMDSEYYKEYADEIIKGRKPSEYEILKIDKLSKDEVIQEDDLYDVWVQDKALPYKLIITVKDLNGVYKIKSVLVPGSAS